MSVIVPARDCESTIGATLAGIAAQQLDQAFEVLVVDNGSRDGTVEAVVASGVEPLRRERGDGPGAARDAGAAAARGDLLAFVDADAVPQPGWLRAGVAALAGADLVQGAVLTDPNAVPGPFDRVVSVTRESGLYETANLFVRREVWERVGGFGAASPAGAEGAPFGEDVVFGWRARRLGARTRFAPDAVVHHAVVPRGAAGYLAEARRRGRFPELARAVPELRGAFFYRRAFLDERSARFAAAVAGAALAGAVRRRWPLAAALPYLALVTGDARRSPRWAAVRLGADAVGFAALVAGSIRARSLVL